MSRSEKLLSVMEAKELWYHGRSTQNTNFDLKFVGKGHDQEGPGFYFTSNYDDAAGYAHPKGVVLTCNLTMKKMVSPKGQADRNVVKELIKKAPDYLDSLTNWDENPHVALETAIDSMMAYGNAKEVYESVWADFYRYTPDEYLKNLISLGYDGVFATRTSEGIRHVIMYNPKKIKILKVDKV